MEWFENVFGLKPVMTNDNKEELLRQDLKEKSELLQAKEDEFKNKKKELSELILKEHTIIEESDPEFLEKSEKYTEQLENDYSESKIVSLLVAKRKMANASILQIQKSIFSLIDIIKNINHTINTMESAKIKKLKSGLITTQTKSQRFEDALY